MWIYCQSRWRWYVNWMLQWFPVSICSFFDTYLHNRLMHSKYNSSGLIAPVCRHDHHSNTFIVAQYYSFYIDILENELWIGTIGIWRLPWNRNVTFFKIWFVPVAIFLRKLIPNIESFRKQSLFSPKNKSILICRLCILMKFSFSSF